MTSNNTNLFSHCSGGPRSEIAFTGPVQSSLKRRLPWEGSRTMLLGKAVSSREPVSLPLQAPWSFCGRWIIIFPPPVWNPCFSCYVCGRGNQGKWGREGEKLVSMPWGVLQSKKKHRIFDIKDYLSGGDSTSQSTKSSFLDKTEETHLDVELKEEGTRAARSTEMAGSGGKPIKAQLPWQGVEANVTTREL